MVDDESAEKAISDLFDDPGVLATLGEANVEAGNLPLRGAIGETCAALALDKPVHIASPDMKFATLRKALGSWIHHPSVTVSDRIETALTRTLQTARSPQNHDTEEYSA